MASLIAFLTRPSNKSPIVQKLTNEPNPAASGALHSVVGILSQG
jgi:hypothetical protein